MAELPQLDPPLHSLVGKLLEALRAADAWHETFTHEAVLTSEAAAATRPGYSLAQGAKAILVKAGDSFALLVMPADCKFEAKLVKKTLRCRDLRFASAEELAAQTGGVLSGAVPPLGSLMGLKTYVDPGLFEHQKICFNAGDRRFSVGMLAEDYRRIENPTVVALTSAPATEAAPKKE